jgi:protein-S-isoprenylcysteine O-methyltransferase Ste14
MLGWTGLRWLGAALILAGLPVLGATIVRFVRQGRGVPAPVLPAQRLVVTGLYRYVRNPMYIAVLAVIVGQGLLFGSTPALRYAVAVAAGFQLFVLLHEEPSLRRRFGSEYEAYCRAVRRWRPRLTPWTGPPPPA